MRDSDQLHPSTPDHGPPAFHSLYVVPRIAPVPLPPGYRGGEERPFLAGRSTLIRQRHAIQTLGALQGQPLAKARHDIDQRDRRLYSDGLGTRSPDDEANVNQLLVQGEIVGEEEAVIAQAFAMVGHHNRTSQLRSCCHLVRLLECGEQSANLSIGEVDFSFIELARRLTRHPDSGR